MPSTTLYGDDDEDDDDGERVMVGVAAVMKERFEKGRPQVGYKSVPKARR